LNVDVNADADWSLNETPLYVGEDPPTKAAPGKFAYKDVGCIKIKLGSTPTCDDPINVALHACSTTIRITHR